MRVAFVLSGGASLGASQAGVLQALYEHGIRPDLQTLDESHELWCAPVAQRHEVDHSGRTGVGLEVGLQDQLPSR
jgi:NTE family protein